MFTLTKYFLSLALSVALVSVANARAGTALVTQSPQASAVAAAPAVLVADAAHAGVFKVASVPAATASDQVVFAEARSVLGFATVAVAGAQHAKALVAQNGAAVAVASKVVQVVAPFTAAGDAHVAVAGGQADALQALAA